MSAQSLLIKAIANNYRPRVINIDKSGSNTAAIKVYNKRSFSKIKIRQCKYLNNIVEQDHLFIKCRNPHKRISISIGARAAEEPYFVLERVN